MEEGPPPRLGNAQRAAWRHKCRQSLADHLREAVFRLTSRLSADLNAGRQLGIVIEPNLVRLIPSSEDEYIWIREPEREHLFKKQLSKQSTGAYMELFREVGFSIRAAAPHQLTNSSKDGSVVCLDDQSLLYY